jgi:hypothetical protein
MIIVRSNIKITAEQIKQGLPKLSKIQQKLIGAFYGINQPKERNLWKLSSSVNMNVFDVEMEIIKAIQIIKEGSENNEEIQHRLFRIG